MTANLTESNPLQTWQNFLNEGLFQLQQCQACDQHVFYPRVLCPHCGSQNLTWKQASGLGTVYSMTMVARRANQGGPYNVALIDLDEGVRLMSRVEGIGSRDNVIGMRVKHKIISQTDQAVLVFTVL